MDKKEMNLEVDDYLDLYLLAGKLYDPEWQQEIFEELQNHLNKSANQATCTVGDVQGNDDDDFEDLFYDLFGWI